jgi:hypothetical protein
MNNQGNMTPLKEQNESQVTSCQISLLTFIVDAYFFNCGLKGE